jgi:hypothetical protein
MIPSRRPLKSSYPHKIGSGSRPPPPAGILTALRSPPMRVESPERTRAAETLEAELRRRWCASELCYPPRRPDRPPRADSLEPGSLSSKKEPGRAGIRLDLVRRQAGAFGKSTRSTTSGNKEFLRNARDKEHRGPEPFSHPNLYRSQRLAREAIRLISTCQEAMGT